MAHHSPPPNPSDSSDSPEMIALVGSAMHFSDHLLSLIEQEFEGIIARRLPSIGALAESRARPRVIVMQDPQSLDPDRLDELRARFPDAMLAYSVEPELVEPHNARNPANPVSVLQLNAQIDVWLSVLRLLLSGCPYVPVSANGPATPLRDAVPPGPQPAHLTPREREILPLIAEGQPNKVIADRLGLSVHTVKLHSHNIFAKLGVANRTGAANWYLSRMAQEAQDNAPDRPR